MIASKDRSNYIGASDTSYVVGNWKTKSFASWWRAKQGLQSNDFTNNAMLTGTAYEHAILASLNIYGLEMDRQIIKGRLRVNYDGTKGKTIYEVKTYRLDKGFKVSKKYREQVNVEMYALGSTEAYIIAYGLTDQEYRNYYIDIDLNRISWHSIEYGKDFINNIYLPRLEYLSRCLDRGTFPSVEEFERETAA